MLLDDEQKIAVDAIVSGHCVAMNAVFGSGKTTTILESVKRLPKHSRCILITYNTHLKNEVHQKCKEMDLTTNLSVYTYHSLAMKYFGMGKNDEELMMVDMPKIEIPEIDVVFIDEIQDMTLVLYAFVKKFMKLLTKKPQVIVCGDHLQGVYRFKGADKRFLTLSRCIFDFDFFECQIQTSYRLTDPMGWFINECVYGKKILKTCKPGNPIVFFNTYSKACINNIVERLEYKIINENLKPEDIFILAPSLKGSRNSPIKMLENQIYEKLNFPIYYCTMEERELNDEVIRGKVVFSTFHQSKGRERNLVILFGFDESYYEYYAKDESRLECPSTVIVGLSRAKKDLFIVKNVNRRPLPFLKMSILDMANRKDKIVIVGKYSDVENIEDRVSTDQFKKVSVSELVKYIKPDFQSVILDLKNKLFEKKSGIVDDVQFSNFIQCGDLSEDVSDLVGILVPSIYEENQTGISTVKKKIIESIYDPDCSDFLKQRIAKINLQSSQIQDLLYLIKVYKALDIGIYSPFQINNDHWISTELIERMIDNIRYHIKSKQIFEYDFNEDSERPIYYNHPDFGKILLSGRIDSMDSNYVWEFKCVREITIEHFLQVVCYQWLWNLVMKDKFKGRIFRLLNIRTGEMYEMKNDEELVNDIVGILMINRYSKLISISDQEFIDSCLGFI